MDNLFSTHPNVENRIARLNKIAQRMVQHSGSEGAAIAMRDLALGGQRKRPAGADAGLGTRPDHSWHIYEL